MNYSAFVHLKKRQLFKIFKIFANFALQTISFPKGVKKDGWINVSQEIMKQYSGRKGEREWNGKRMEKVSFCQQIVEFYVYTSIIYLSQSIQYFVKWGKKGGTFSWLLHFSRLLLWSYLLSWTVKVIVGRQETILLFIFLFSSSSSSSSSLSSSFSFSNLFFFYSSINKPFLFGSIL